jgi:sulfide:quinone oxidoreductase
VAAPDCDNQKEATLKPTWLTPKLAVSPQIQLSDLAELKAQGFRAIVNNRPDGEAPGQPSSDALETEALRVGLSYTFLPIAPGVIDDHDAAAFARMLRESSGPLLAFCRSGSRSTMLWKYTVELQGGDPEC